MKKLLLFSALLSITIYSCKKSDSTTPTTTTPSTTTTTQPTEGTWKITVYDGLAVTSPMAGSIKLTGNSGSSTTGTAQFDMTFDGVIHMTENDSYTLSGSNAKIDFVKTSGRDSVLQGGSTWNIDTLNSNTLRMTSKYGLIIKATK